MQYCIENLKLGQISSDDISFICEPEMYGRGMGEQSVYKFQGVNIKIDKQL